MRLLDRFTDTERATLHLVADCLEARGAAASEHIARLREIARKVEQRLPEPEANWQCQLCGKRHAKTLCEWL